MILTQHHKVFQMVHGLEIIAKMNETASVGAARPIEVVVAEDSNSDTQSLYVSGQFCETETVIYASEILKHVRTSAMVLTFADVTGYFTDPENLCQWPQSYADLVPYIETSVGF